MYCGGVELTTSPKNPATLRQPALQMQCNPGQQRLRSIVEILVLGSQRTQQITENEFQIAFQHDWQIDNGCLNRPVMVHTQIVAQNTWFSLKILVVEKGATLQENILKEAPCLNKKMALGYGMLTGEFCMINREFSDLQCLMNTVRTKILVSLTV